MKRTYNYQCKTCNEKFEVEREIDETSKPRCPKCKSRDTKKLISATPVIYTDSDFTQYKTG